MLGVAGLGLIAAVAFSGMGLSKTLEPVEVATMAVKKDAQQLSLEEFQTRMDRLGIQYDSRAGTEERVFTSELRVPSVNKKDLYVLIPIDAKKCPYTGAEQPDLDKRDTDGDGLLDGYERANGLNVAQADAWEDSDQDGFFNIEEFKSGTAANDADSHPPYVAKLRLVKAANQPQRFEIVGVTKFSDTNIVFSLKMGGPKTHFVKIGVEVDGWKLIKWTPREPETVGAPDLSTLLISNGEDEVLLTKNKPGVLNKWKAGLVYLADKNVKFMVQEGGEFELEGEKYIVDKISRSEVKVMSVAKKEPYFLQKISSDEIAILKGELKPGQRATFGASKAKKMP